MLPTLEAPELVFGLCSPIGTDNAKVIRIIQNELLVYGYEATLFKVTTLMRDAKPNGFELISTPIDRRYDSYINYANELRRLVGQPSALAMMSVAAVRANRRKTTGQPSKYSPSKAYIFDQFKRKEEIEALRQVYGRLFISVSIYSDKTKRQKNLAQRIAADHADPRTTRDHEHSASNLINRDENEEGVQNGQRLRDAFPLADLFINIDDEASARFEIERFLKGMFGSNLVSPTRDEYGMYMAQSAALRSLDLSRQVGAAIFSPKGEVISLGCNEVPKAGGGTYWTGDKQDSRDYTIGRDENERVKRALLKDVVHRLVEGNYLQTELSDLNTVVDDIIQDSGKKESVLRDALLMDVLEFGRAIHAEMSAITDAARTGRAVCDATLFCTTFPCHMCAKHIIASGLNRVVFIEPYPKSYAEELHKEITVGTGGPDSDRVRFSPFIGIAPRRFKEVFERGRRKDSVGSLTEWAAGKPRLIVSYTVANYLTNEEAFTKILEKRLESLREEGLIAVATGASASS